MRRSGRRLGDAARLRRHLGIPLRGGEVDDLPAREEVEAPAGLDLVLLDQGQDLGDLAVGGGLYFAAAVSTAIPLPWN